MSKSIVNACLGFWSEWHSPLPPSTVGRMVERQATPPTAAVVRMKARRPTLSMRKMKRSSEITSTVSMMAEFRKMSPFMLDTLRFSPYKHMINRILDRKESGGRGDLNDM